MRSTEHSGPGALAAKVEIRRRVLDAVPHACVFDAFAGPGGMWSAIWKQAEHYLGCDREPFKMNEPHKRLVCDNLLALRCLELGRFNVFDFDAYGSPWEQMTILAARRPWKTGERGAVVVTDGTSLKLRFGGAPHAMARLAGIPPGAELPRSTQMTGQPFEQALAGWTRRAGVKPLKRWQAFGRGSGRGGAQMRYVALVFEGR